MDLITVSDPPEIEHRLWSGWHGQIAYYVGANSGQHLPKLASSFDRIFAFEPHAGAAEAARNLAASLHIEADIMCMAVSDHDGQVTLANLIGTRQEKTGQLVTPHTSGMEWDPGITEWDNPLKVQQVHVPCATLDSLVMSLGQPEFVLIDTEGHELLIIEGARDRVLTDIRPGFLVEFHTPENHDELVRIFNQYGYWAETIRHPHYPPRTLMWFQHGWIKAKPLPRAHTEEHHAD